jgi:hypothetical protein
MTFATFKYEEKEKILRLFETHQIEYNDISTCLAQICVQYKIKPCCFKNISLHFNDRTFRRRIKLILAGNGDGKIVLCIMKFLFFFLG